MKYKLISFSTCPFVHRSAITLEYKDIDYEVVYIDLKNKPDRFLKISPRGKVPVLIIDDEHVIFESAVINELLDELNSPRLLPEEPIQKAKYRAWIDLSGDILKDMAGMAFAKDKETFDSNYNNFFEKLNVLEPNIGHNGFFDGKDFSLIDSSYAPVFFRISFFSNIMNEDNFKDLPKCKKRIDNLANMNVVKYSLKDTFYEDFEKSLKDKGSYLYDYLKIN